MCKNFPHLQNLQLSPALRMSLWPEPLNVPLHREDTRWGSHIQILLGTLETMLHCVHTVDPVSPSCRWKQGIFQKKQSTAGMSSDMKCIHFHFQDNLLTFPGLTFTFHSFPLSAKWPRRLPAENLLHLMNATVSYLQLFFSLTTCSTTCPFVAPSV